MLRERPKSSNKRRSYKGDSSATIDDEENETGRLKDWQISRKDENQRSFVAMQITANKLENDGLNSVLCSMQIHDPLHKHRHTHTPLAALRRAGAISPYSGEQCGSLSFCTFGSSAHYRAKDAGRTSTKNADDTATDLIRMVVNFAIRTRHLSSKANTCIACCNNNIVKNRARNTIK